MGFSTIATATASTLASVLPKVIEAKSAFAQSKALNRAADEQERMAGKQASAIESTASANQMRGSRNALAEQGQARVDAAVSNTLQEGSTYERGADLATRLQDEINATANEQLMRANSIRSQAAYDAWDLRNQARQSRSLGKAAIASGIGSLFAGIGAGIAGASSGGSSGAGSSSEGQ